MIPVEELRFLTIDLGQGDTELEECRALPEREYRGTFYATTRHPLSIVELPDDPRDYEYGGCSTVARQNARFAERLGYRHRIIDRAEWEDDLHELRASAEFRQGRRMPDAYLERQSYSSDRWPEPHCKRHLSTVHGVVSEQGRLVAYAHLVQSGEVVRVNTILGHAAHLEHRVVWTLILRSLQWHIQTAGARFGLYYTHESGHGPGLRYQKERLGFRPTRVRWLFA